jgi:outer membrane protein TolC
MKPGFLSSLAALWLTALFTSAAPAPEQPVPDKLDLKDALQFGLENNFTIRQARERIKQQEGVEIEVRARQLPNVAAGGSYTLNDREISQYVPQSDRNWSIALQARQVLYAGGGVQASVKSARLAREAAVLELQGIINEQLLLVRTRFYTVLLDQQRITVQEENVRLLEEQLKNAKSRLDAGATSNFEVLRAEVALANGRPPLIQARNDFRLSIEELRQALGYVNGRSENVAKVPEFLGSLEIGQPVEYQLPDALATARANRPELQRLAKLTDSSEARVVASRASARPELDLIGSYNVVRGPFSPGWASRLDGLAGGLQVQWNIWDGRATAGRVAQAKSQLLQTHLSLDEATLAVEVGVRRAFSSLQEAWELVQSTGKVVSQAEEALRLANVRYNAGTATQLDVLTSQVALTEARLNQLLSYYGYNVALATMRQAVGQADPFVTNG